MTTWIKPEHKEPILRKIAAFSTGDIIYILPASDQDAASLKVYYYYVVLQEFTPTEQKSLIRVQIVEPYLTSIRRIAREEP